MSCTQAIYAANLTSQSLSSGDTVRFGSIVRKIGKALNLSGGNISIVSPGYYEVSVNATLTAGAAGTAGMALLKNGIQIPGARQTVTVAADSVYPLSFTAIVRETCDCESTITAEMSGTAAASISTAAISVTRL